MKAKAKKEKPRKGEKSKVERREDRYELQGRIWHKKGQKKLELNFHSRKERTERNRGYRVGTGRGRQKGQEGKVVERGKRLTEDSGTSRAKEEGRKQEGKKEVEA